MQKHHRSRKQRRRRPEDQAIEAVTEPAPARGDQKSDRLGPLYNAGPVHELSPRAEQTLTADAEQETEPGSAPAASETTSNEQQPLAQPSQPIVLPPIRTHDSRADQRTVVYGTSIRLRGRTDSGDFTYSSSTENIRAVRGTGCTGCGSGDCLRVTGTLIVTYSIQPTVTLPSLSDYPNLTQCQQRRVQNAIQNVLAPHEQQHVAAFRTYAGTTRRNFDLTICRSEWNESTIDAMVKPEQAARQSAAIAASNALDPFFFDVDLDCTDTPAKGPSKQSASGDGPASLDMSGNVDMPEQEVEKIADEGVQEEEREEELPA
jgi:hypothetical protein